MLAVPFFLKEAGFFRVPSFSNLQYVVSPAFLVRGSSQRCLPPSGSKDCATQRRSSTSNYSQLYFDHDEPHCCRLHPRQLFTFVVLRLCRLVFTFWRRLQRFLYPIWRMQGYLRCLWNPARRLHSCRLSESLRYWPRRRPWSRVWEMLVTELKRPWHEVYQSHHQQSVSGYR